MLTYFYSRVIYILKFYNFSLVLFFKKHLFLKQLINYKIINLPINIKKFTVLKSPFIYNSFRDSYIIKIKSYLVLFEFNFKYSFISHSIFITFLSYIFINFMYKLMFIKKEKNNIF
jgi:hypothetical protein